MCSYVAHNHDTASEHDTQTLHCTTSGCATTKLYHHATRHHYSLQCIPSWQSLQFFTETQNRSTVSPTITLPPYETPPRCRKARHPTLLSLTAPTMTSVLHHRLNHNCNLLPPWDPQTLQLKSGDWLGLWSFYLQPKYLQCLAKPFQYFQGKLYIITLSLLYL